MTRLYYQHNVNRLSMCPLTLHAILHIPDDIMNNGPCCYNWTFIMERWCGALLPAIKSRVRPFVSLSLRQLHLAQLNVIKARYKLAKELSLAPRSGTHGETCYEKSDCEFH